MNSNMILTDILKGSEYSLILFKQDNINSLEERIITKMNKKRGRRCLCDMYCQKQRGETNSRGSSTSIIRPRIN